MKNVQSLQADLQSFKHDNMNEIKEQKEINEALLWNLTEVNPHGKPINSTNKYREGYHRKRTSKPKEEGREEHTPELPERDCHGLSNDNSISPCRKRQKIHDNLQGEFWKIKAPTYEGEMNIKERVEWWLLGMRKYFQVHS